MDAQGVAQQARWRSENGAAVPRRAVIADDTLGADAAYRLACEGTALVWAGDFHNARQLLQALARRADRVAPTKAKARAKVEVSPKDRFNLHRQAQSQRARVLGMLVIVLDADYGVPLRRAPDWRLACREAYGEPGKAPTAVSLRELLGVVGAHEWRKAGVEIAELGADGQGSTRRIHAHYGVFSPVRGEYVALVATTPLPAACKLGAPALDIGTGTGVLAAVLAGRGVARVLATENSPRALACAADNFARLGLSGRVTLCDADLFPPLADHGLATLIVCNPPWLPARPSSVLEHAVYDPDSRMLRGYLNGLAAHLAPGGEGWLILSDLAEHLGLRSRDELLAWIAGAGLRVLGRGDVRPQHRKVADVTDPLHAARAAEVTSLWRLGVVAPSPT
jgi:methylase of polypeptide subunit release factors